MASKHNHILFSVWLFLIIILIFLFLAIYNLPIILDWLSKNSIHVLVSFLLLLFGGILPDIIEPANFWLHRKFFHSKLFFFLLIFVLGIFVYLFFIQVAIFYLYIISIIVGYLGHLFLDMRTKRGLS